MAGAAFVLFAGVLAALFLAGAHVSSRLFRDGDGPALVDRPDPGDASTRSDRGSARAGSSAVGHVDAPGQPAALREPDSPVDRASPGVEGRPLDLSPGVLFANVLLTHGLLAGALLAGVVVFGVSLPAMGVSGEPAVAGPPAVGLGVAFGLALWVGNEAVAAAADAVGAAYDERLRELLAPDSGSGWVVLLALVLPVVAGAEELLFRAALIGVPAAALDVSPWLLAVVSSAAFALGHGAQGRAGIVVTGLLGLALAAGFVLTASLLVVVVAHYVVNAMEFVVHEGLGAGRLGRAGP